MKTAASKTELKRWEPSLRRRLNRTLRERGSALLAVFWSIMVLTLAVSGWFFWLQQRVQEHGEDARAAEAMAMAHSGYAVASHPNVNRFSSLLRAEPLPGIGYDVSIERESGRLNIKWTFEQPKGAHVNRREFFRNWLQTVIGIEDLFVRDRLMDCLEDYVDGDNITSLNGQEDSPTYHPANRMIQDLDELKRIPGLEPLISYPGWKELLTLDSKGPLDLMEMPEEVLRLLPGFGEPKVQSWLRIRAGPDQVLHTEDDFLTTDPTQLRTALGIQGEQPWEKLVTVNEPTQRIICRGYSGKVVRQLQVVVRKGKGAQGASQIFSWIE